MKVVPLMRMKIPGIIVFCCAFLLFPSLNHGSAATNTVEVTEIQGLVQIKKLGVQEWLKAEENSKLVSGDKIRAFLESSALLIFPDKSEFRLGENSFLDIKDVSQNPRMKTARRELKLNLGTLHYKIPPKKETAAEFKIHSSTSIVGITGTEGIMFARGKDKPTENILIEGATFNTDDEGKGGVYQTDGNIYRNDGQRADVFASDTRAEAKARLKIDEEYVQLVDNLISQYKTKKEEGYHVGDIETFIEQAFSYLENREYARVRKITTQAVAKLEKAEKSDIPDDLKKKIEDVMAQIRSPEGESKDFSDIYLLLEKIYEDTQSGNFKRVENSIVLIKQKLASLTEENTTGEGEKGDAFLKHFQKIQESVLEKETMGFSLDEIKAALRESYIYYKNADLTKAFSLMDKASNNLQMSLKQVSDSLQKKLDNLNAEIMAKKKEGYLTEEAAWQLQEIKRLIKKEAFLKARNGSERLEDSLLTLRKGIPAGWQVKLSALKKKLKYKESMGYELTGTYDHLKALEQHIHEADLTQLEEVYLKIEEALSKLALPAGFDANWQAFLKMLTAQEAMGFDLKETIGLKEKIQAAVESGDIKLARSFLKKARETLRKTEDNQPPLVQILTFKEGADVISLEGFASDNTQVKSISINNSLVPLSQEGKFTYSSVPAPDLKTLTIIARDIADNLSPPITIGIKTEIPGSDIKGKISEAGIEYSENSFLVKGQFLPGGKVVIGDQETFCNQEGQFKVLLKPDAGQRGKDIHLVGWNFDGTHTEDVVLNVEDKWSPIIDVERVYFTQNVVPALKLEPLNYTESSVLVAGKVDVAVMANIEGKVSDAGGSIGHLKILGREIDVREDGQFLAILAISPKDVSTIIVAEDQAGNRSQVNVPFDAVLHLPEVKIKARNVRLDSEGKFQEEIFLTKDTKEIVVELKGAEGKQIASQNLPVADILPPALEISDISFAENKVTITGHSDALATIQEKDKRLFTETYKASADGTFTLSAPFPENAVDIILTATNIEGKQSVETAIKIDPAKDEKAPSLYISSPEFSEKTVIISGFAEDDSGLATLTIQKEAAEVNEEGHFSKELTLTDKITSIQIAALDTYGNEARQTVALSDQEPPQLFIDTWEIQGGKIVISGKALDNVGLKEVRVNKMPIARGEGQELPFSYEGAITGDSKDIVLVAVDLFNNEVKEGPRPMQIPTDTTPPQGGGLSLEYGSPVIYMSGQVDDPAGLKAVYVNGEETEVFSDGSFHIRVDIEVGPPKLTIEAPSYDNGKVTIAGKVSAGDFTPSKITVEAEDLSGNRGILFSQEAAPYRLKEITVIVDGQVVVLNEEGAFRQEQGITLGARSIEVTAVDPFENRAASNVDLENTPPLLTLNEITYNVNKMQAVLSGKATDGDSGLYTLLVNGIRMDLDGQGNFSYSASLTETALGVVATDYAGNVTSLTKKVSPPDIWPPVFSIDIKPMPAIIGNPVYIEITAMDSRTAIPEMLAGPPDVTADIEGSAVSLPLEGEGANYIATLETTGLTTALVTISIEGSDQSGNSSNKIEGTSAFTLIDEDAIVPSFTLEAQPSPIELGEESTIKAFASEEIIAPPELTAVLPSGETRSLDLNKISGQEFDASLTVPLEEGIGLLILRLTGGGDSSGNIHETTETTVDVIAPVQETEIPLNIDLIKFVPEYFTIKGITASEAVVQIAAGEYSQDIVADVEGKFSFEQPVSFDELEQMHSATDVIRVRVKAHNYAGFESPARVFEIALPPLPEKGGEHYNIFIQPEAAEQGQTVNFNIEVLQTQAVPPQGFLYLPDGQRAVIDLQGTENLTGQYPLPEDAALGTAMFEVAAGTVRENINFEIVLSSAWNQRLNKDEFFMIRVMPDPIVIGKEAEFIVHTKGDLPAPPQMRLLLPDGRSADISLSGGPRVFQGRYLTPDDVPSGRAEIVLNPGTPEEVRRPCGVEEEFIEGVGADAFLYANPNPLLGGQSFEVQVNFSKNIPFKPRLVLKLNDGRGLDIPLDGSAPSNRFSANATLQGDVVSGLANFILKDNNGMFLDKFPTQVIPPLSIASGITVFVMPDMLQHSGTATIKLDSTRAIKEKLMAHVSFVDGRKIVVPLTGRETAFNGKFQVPDNVPFGRVTIVVFGADGRSLGTTRSEVVVQGHKGGMLKIFLNNPELRPGDNIRIGVDAGWPLPFIPKAELLWDGGSLRIPLRGSVPGNRFGGNFTVPAEPIAHGRIEVKDDAGYMLGDYHIEHRRKGAGDVIVTPMPPVIGQPLSIRVTAPSVINSRPTMRLTFIDGGQRDLNAYGAIPGDAFTASLDQLKNPLQLIEIIYEGNVVASIPVEGLNMPPPEFDVEPVGELAPCAMVDIMVRARAPVPFIPHVNIDFQGKIVDVPLSQMSPKEFFGKLNIPCDASFDGVKAMVFDPQGRLLWQRMYSQETEGGGFLPLYVMPSGDDGFDLTWEMIPGVRMYELRYGETVGLGNKVEVRGSSFHHLAGLEDGKTYFFQVAAFMRRREIMSSDIIPAVVGQTMRELFVQDMIMGNEVHLMWTDYPGAEGYRVVWGDAPGALANSAEVTGTGFLVPNLVMGTTYYMKVFALSAGQNIGESREIMIPLQMFQVHGGDVSWNPMPAVQGQDLKIFIHAFNDLPFIPEVIARLNRGDVSLQPSGQGRDFTALLTGDAFTSRLISVDVMDPEGRHLFGRPAGGPGGGYGGGPMLPIIATPDPPMIGMKLNIRVEFPQPPPFAPRLMLELASGGREYTFPGGPNQSMYEITIPAADLTSSVMRAEVKDPSGMMLGDRFFGTVGPRHGGPMIMVNPNPPVISQDMNVNVDFGYMVPFVPKMLIEFEDGRRYDHPVSGNPGMTSYSTTVPASVMTSYVRRIEIKDDRDMFLGDWFPGGRGTGPDFGRPPLMVQPNPPMIAAPVDMTLDVGEKILMGPRLRIQYMNGSQEEVSMQGSTPGQHFNYHIDSLISEIEFIDVIDPSTGEVKFTWMPGGRGRYDGPEIILNCPPPGQPLDVSVNFLQPVPFVPQVYIEFTNGIRKGPYYFPQAQGLASYQTIIPADQITGAIKRVEIQDDRGMYLGDEFCGTGDPQMCSIILDHSTPPLGLPLTVSVDFPQPVPFIPRLYVEFQNGPKTYTFTQPIGMIFYQFTIPAADMTSPVMKMEILDDTGNLICDRHFGPGGQTSCNIMVDFDPPLMGQPMNVTAEFSSPVFDALRLYVEFEDGRRPQYLFNQAPGLSMYSTIVPQDQMTSAVMRIVVENNTGLRLCDRPFGPQLNFTCTAAFNPDPPIPYTDVIATATYGANNAPSYTPYVLIEFENGTLWSQLFDQGPGSVEYSKTIPGSLITDNVRRMGFGKDPSSIDCGKDFSPTGSTLYISTTPDPPEPYTNMGVTVDFEHNVPFTPKMEIGFADGTTKTFTFSQPPGYMTYFISIPASEITDNIDWIDIQDDLGTALQPRKSFTAGGLTVTITVDPDPPTPGTPLNVTAVFSQNVPFVPKLGIEFEDGSSKAFSFSQAGLSSYTMTVPAAEMTGPVDLLGMLDVNYNVIPNGLNFGGFGAFDITGISAFGQDKIDLCWDFDTWVNEYWIYYGTASGNYNGSDSPVKVSNISCYRLGDYETLTSNYTYYVKVEAYDHNNAMVFTSQEWNVALSSNTVPYPATIAKVVTGISGEIKVIWDQVTGATIAGYKVYYGESTRTYNGTGTPASPIDITDPNTLQTIISGLNDATAYYITVEAYDTSNTESANPNEITACPGDNSCGGPTSTLSATPLALAISGSPGSSVTQQSVNIGNSAASTANVQVLFGDLVKAGGGTIPSSNIAVAPTSISIPASGSDNFTIDISIPGGTADGNYGGTFIFFDDANSNSTHEAATEASVSVSVGVAVSTTSTDHIEITSSDTSSPLGDPIFVTLTAHDASHNTVNTHNTPVTITVSESSNGQLASSWLVSVQDRVTAGGASTGTVGMAQGKGFFTVDALEPETITIGTSGISNDGDLILDLTANAGVTLSSFAIDGPSKAITGVGADDGAVFWLSPVDASGNVITNSTDSATLTITASATATMTLVQGGGAFSGVGPYIYTFVAGDNGLARFRLQDTTAGALTISETGGTGSNNYAVTFEGVKKFLVFESPGGTPGTIFSSLGSPQTKSFTIKAALSNNQIVTNYNGAVTWVCEQEGGVTCSAASATTINFSNGTANFNVSTDEFETVEFHVEDNTDNTITTGTITVNYESIDGTEPEVTEVVAETPWLIRIRFSEDIDSTNALNPNNYTGVGTIDKVCWYGDNVTLNLNAALTLGSSPNVTIKGATSAGANAVQDLDGNKIQDNDVVKSFTVPNVDYQGAALGGSDWFELQPSVSSPAPGATVQITVFHKNACGYLTGDNAVNASTSTSGSSSPGITYGGTASVSGPSSVGLSGGTASFSLTVNAAATNGQTITVSLSDGTVSTLTDLTLTVQ